MYLRSDEKELGKENFFAAVGSKPIRRDFLQKAARQGLTLRGGLGGYYFNYGKSLDKPLVVGILGAGRQGCRLLGALNPAFITLKAIADIRPSSQKQAIERLLRAAKGKGEKSAEDIKQQVHVTGAYKELLSSAKADGLEAVIIALPSHLHAPAAVAAMQAGLHVFTETPMALSVGDAKAMARLAKEKQLCLAVGQQRRYSLLYNNALELVRRGLLDDIHYIRAQWHLADGQTNAEDIAHNEDKPKKAEKKGPSKDDNRPDWWREVPPEDAGVQVRAHGYESIESLVRWQLRENLSGGLLMELGQHLFDAAAMFMAATPNRDQQTAYPLSVAASAGRLRPDAEGDLDDHVYCVFEYPVAGYLAEGPRKTRKKIGLQYDLIIGNQFDGYGETVLGKQGSLVLDRQQRGLLYHTSDTDKRIRVVEKKAGKGGPSHVALEVPKEHPQASDDEAAAIGQMALVGADPGFVAELEHWAWCVRNPKDKPRGDAEAGLASTVIAAAAAKAVKSGDRIDFDKAWFDPASDETPEGVKPDLGRYKA